MMMDKIEEEVFIKFLDEEEKKRMVKILEITEEKENKNGFYWLKVLIEQNGKKEVITFTKRDKAKKWNMQPSLNYFTKHDLETLLGEVNKEVII